MNLLWERESEEKGREGKVMVVEVDSSEKYLRVVGREFQRRGEEL